ncbi:MAG: DUF368 domain-containing protein, partial [Flavobacteriia bacterium]
YKLGENGEQLYDSLGNKVIENYHRFIPDLQDGSTWIAMGYIFFGIIILIILEWYGRNTKSKVKPKL